MQLWSDNQLQEDRWVVWRIGQLALWIKRSGNEFMFGSVYSRDLLGNLTLFDSDNPDENSMPPRDAEWIRVVINRTQITGIRMYPVMPPRPVVVTTPVNVRLPSRQRSRFLAEIPVWLRIVTADSIETVLFEAPTELLSNTWFGDPINGTLSYTVHSPMVSNRNMLGQFPHRAVCMMYIRNASKDFFDFKRLSVDVPFLSLYRGESHLWTNDVQIIFIGENKINILLSDKKPESDKGASLWIKPRQEPDKNVLRKSMTIFRTMTGF